MLPEGFTELPFMQALQEQPHWPLLHHRPQHPSQRCQAQPPPRLSSSSPQDRPLPALGARQLHLLRHSHQQASHLPACCQSSHSHQQVTAGCRRPHAPSVHQAHCWVAGSLCICLPPGSCWQQPCWGTSHSAVTVHLSQRPTASVQVHRSQPRPCRPSPAPMGAHPVRSSASTTAPSSALTAQMPTT